MDIIFQLQGVEFKWDESKARANVEKHGVTFEEAAEASTPSTRRVTPRWTTNSGTSSLVIHYLNVFYL